MNDKDKKYEEAVKEITKQVVEALKSINLDFDVYGVGNNKVYKYDEKDKTVKSKKVEKIK